MKLAILATQYFYQHRKLSLPGIGIFSLDDSVAIPDMADKNFRDFLQHIQFKQSNVLRAEDGLIEFIRTHTGKIKPLAESDLESFVADGKLLLNIGKPFHIDGIGTLSKNRNGVYEFTPGEPLMERIESHHPVKEREKEKEREKSGTPPKKSVFDDDYYPHESKGAGSRRLIILAGIVLGLAVVIWGGYSLYNSKVDDPANVVSDTNILEADSTAQQQQADSVAQAKAIADSIAAANSLAPGSYKFIFETTASKRRALTRHAKVNELSPGIKLESDPDSSRFKIYVVLPASAADTTRLKDSLKAWYWGPRPFKITIEH